MKTERVKVAVDPDVIFGNDPWAVIEPVYWVGNIYDSYGEYEASLARFSQEQRLMFALHWYRAEVNNGGHDQFYSNSTGIVWADALAAFEALELADGSDIVRESARRLGGSPSFDREERENQLESSFADFEDLDERFYALEQDVDLDAAMLRFMRANVNQFIFSDWIERPAI